MLLADDVVLRSVGTLTLDDYFAFLNRVDVAVSLQASPHPSHPPLEAAIAGAISITNDFEHTREALHPRLRAVEAHPKVLGEAIVAAIEEVQKRGRGSFAAPRRDSLRSATG